MKFEDLSLYDLNELKGHAIYRMNNTSMSRFEALADATLSCIYAKGYKLSPYPDKLSHVIAAVIQTDKNLTAEELVKNIFEFIKELNIDISKESTREATWSEPRSCWYSPYVSYKKPWMF